MFICIDGNHKILLRENVDSLDPSLHAGVDLSYFLLHFFIAALLLFFRDEVVSELITEQLAHEEC